MFRLHHFYRINRMHLQKVCIIFALLIVLVLFFMSRSEGFEQKIVSTTSIPISTVTTTKTQKPTGPIGNSSPLKVSPGLPTLSPAPNIPISALPKLTLQPRQGLTVSQGPVLSNSITGITTLEKFVAYDPTPEE